MPYRKPEATNPRIKVPACGSLTHGRYRRCPYAAAYRDRYLALLAMGNALRR